MWEFHVQHFVLLENLKEFRWILEWDFGAESCFLSDFHIQCYHFLFCQGYCLFWMEGVDVVSSIGASPFDSEFFKYMETFTKT